MSQSALLDAAAALSTFLDVQSGRLAVCTSTKRNRVSELTGVFADEEARKVLANDANPVVYEVYRTEPTEKPDTALCYSSTIVHPGNVAGEYHMTRGHSHPSLDAPEVYLTIRGEGMLLLQTDDLQVQALALGPGTVLYVPGSVVHRLVNTGNEPLIVFTVYTVRTIQEYEMLPAHGFKRILVATNDGPDLVPNPHFEKTAGSSHTSDTAGKSEDSDE
jgi:glucose-6-phosphate isomerase